MLTTIAPRTRRATRFVVVVAAGALFVAACGAEPPAASTSSAPSSTATSRGSSAPAPPGSDAATTTATPAPATTAMTSTTTSGATAASSTTANASPSTLTVPTGGCAAIDGYVTISGGRRALVRAPRSSARRPAVVVLHGYTGTPERIEQTSGWTAFAGPKNVVAVYPEGTPVAGGGFAWTTGSARYSATGADDIGYLDALASTLADRACVDPAHILLTGESNGGAMTLLAACDARTRNRFAMFAPVIPAIDGRVVERCGAGPPLTFTAVASRMDRTIPYDGVYPAGQIALSGQEQWFLQIAAQRNQCSSANPKREPIRDAEVIRPTGCGTAPTLVAVADGSHTWPGGPSGTGGLSPGTFGATAYLWERMPTV